ncbi:helix-turn-helix transcriptional regulator [Nocardiopsis sp. NPDC006198]|uniref:helix-turn-helix domain-containing protein n=1 Tax=Nocardiopsis sp. NPDC006198 TaxID=3154472 RepID=UPI0033A243DC
MTENRNSRTHGGVGPNGSYVARNIRVLRTKRGKTTEALANELTDRGVPLQASAITRIEKGQRRVTVDELVAFAVLLDATPNALLLPVEVDRELPIAVTGHGELAAADAWDWLDGDSPLPSRGPSEDGDSEDFEDTVRPWWKRAPVRLPRGLRGFEKGVDQKRRMADRARAHQESTDLRHEDQGGEDT